MKWGWRITIGIILIGFLVLVRQFESWLFYDPFMAFFYGDIESREVVPLQWYVNLALRYLVNSLISLGILYCCFPKPGIVKFSALLYLLLFVELFPLFGFLMQSVTYEDYLTVFYIRRFLAHPILLLLLIPAFFYQKLKERS